MELTLRFLQDDHRSGKIVVQLNGRINKTGVISPRFNIQVRLCLLRSACAEQD
jgi:ribosomal protein S8